MPCYRPITAYSVPGAAISFNPGSGGRKIQVSCGSCIGCRWTRQQAWATRCMHENQMHQGNSSFITLTYDEKHYHPSLNYRHVQDFIRNLRKAKRRYRQFVYKRPRYKLGAPVNIRYFAAGEYGDQNKRPHYHALIFGHCFDHRQKVTEHAYESDQLKALWPHGMSSTGEITQASARYCASYCTKKQTGPPAALAYKRVNLETGEIIQVEPEFAHMSLKPAIGYTWFQKYWREIYGPRDGVIQKGGRLIPAPRYYDKLLEQLADREASSPSTQTPTTKGEGAHPGASPRALKSASIRFREIKQRRLQNQKLRAKDNTAQRLAVKEQVHISRTKFFKRRIGI